jgi:hypothetical protein
MTRPSIRRLVRPLLLVLALAALAAPSASARPIEEVGPDIKPVSSVNALPTTSEVRVVSVDSKSGFDWGDAGIGAAAVLALTMIGVGAALTLNHRRAPHGPAAAA